MRIGELSRRSGVSPRSLRYYEQHGLLSASREANGYREYDDATVERAETIHMLFGMDFPRDVVRSVLACTGDSADTSHDVLAGQLERVRSEMAERIERLTDTHRQVSAFLDARAERT
ncbi:MerR family transcriptional regulator [Microbacterium marinilacus]|uniref:MerR family transcriptional regulator n=1 Tax=Microbacterium marinilacus TaxID=415209 RepID=A0ABP7BVE2_9MICO|nr:MerR family transcriptional regulator [Microbacterium marinilacus]MBY0688065.1 MerR family transcriptional regulator [Microbacterium marinilacus]